MCLGRWFQADGAAIENKLSVKRPVAVLGPGRGGLRPSLFVQPPVFPPTTYYCPPPLRARGPGAQSVLARPATGSDGWSVVGYSEVTSECRSKTCIRAWLSEFYEINRCSSIHGI